MLQSSVVVINNPSLFGFTRNKNEAMGRRNIVNCALKKVWLHVGAAEDYSNRIFFFYILKFLPTLG